MTVKTFVERDTSGKRTWIRNLFHWTNRRNFPRSGKLSAHDDKVWPFPSIKAPARAKRRISISSEVAVGNWR